MRPAGPSCVARLMNTLRGCCSQPRAQLVALLMAVWSNLNVYTDRPKSCWCRSRSAHRLADTLAVRAPGALDGAGRRCAARGKQLLKLRLTSPSSGCARGRRVGPFHARSARGPAARGRRPGGRAHGGPVLLDPLLEPRERRTVPVAVPVEGVAAEARRWTGHTLLEPARVLGDRRAARCWRSNTVRLVAVAHRWPPGHGARPGRPRQRCRPAASSSRRWCR